MMSDLNPARFVLLLILAGLLLPGMSLAGDYGLGVRLGTHGAGVEGAVGLRDWVAIRGGLYGGDVSEDFEEGGIDYDGELTVGGVGALADFFPMRGKFRVTAGLFANENEIEFDTTPTLPIEIGGSTYTPAEIGTLAGKVEFDSTAPYAGIGWGNVARGDGRVAFLFDLGVLLQGSPDLSLARSSGVPVPGLDADIQAEIDELEEDTEDYDFWPVISFGVAVRF